MVRSSPKRGPWVQSSGWGPKVLFLSCRNRRFWPQAITRGLRHFGCRLAKTWALIEALLHGFASFHFQRQQGLAQLLCSRRVRGIPTSSPVWASLRTVSPPTCPPAVSELWYVHLPTRTPKQALPPLAIRHPCRPCQYVRQSPWDPPAGSRPRPGTPCHGQGRNGMPQIPRCEGRRDHIPGPPAGSTPLAARFCVLKGPLSICNGCRYALSEAGGLVHLFGHVPSLHQ